MNASWLTKTKTQLSSEKPQRGKQQQQQQQRQQGQQQQPQRQQGRRLRDVDVEDPIGDGGSGKCRFHQIWRISRLKSPSMLLLLWLLWPQSWAPLSKKTHGTSKKCVIEIKSNRSN